jgi:predicted RNase H-like HicB family nuclease
LKYLVVIEKGKTSYGAYVPDLPVCVAVGKTLEEVKERIAGAMEFHIRGMREDGMAIPEPSSKAIEITVP